MTSINRILGGILLIAGTTIGVGLLGIPVTTAFSGFYPSLGLFLISWLFMLLSGFYFIEVNCSLKGETNLCTMAEKTIGRTGRAISWFAYPLLLYSLMSAYISACSPILIKAFEAWFGLVLAPSVANFLLPLFFAIFIYLGTLGVDWLNRLLMIGLVVSYTALIVFIPPHIHLDYLNHVAFKPLLYALPVLMTSFGYHIIIPSLATYVHHNKKSLYLIVIFGSVIALLVNIIWEFLVIGAVPLKNLAEAWNQGVPATIPLSKIITSPWLGLFAYLFSFFAIITSFLGVSLSLSDFLMDGLKIKKSWEGRLIAILLTFIPPLVLVYSYPRIFLISLQYAGVFVAILLIFLPALMVGYLKGSFFSKTVLGKIILSSSVLFAILVIVINFLIQWHFFDPWLQGL